MKMYRSWLNTIFEYEVHRTTDKTIWFSGDVDGKPLRELKNSDTHAWFPTREAAKTYLIEKAENEVRKAERRLKYRLNSLEEAKNL